MSPHALLAETRLLRAKPEDAPNGERWSSRPPAANRPSGVHAARRVRRTSTNDLHDTTSWRDGVARLPASAQVLCAKRGAPGYEACVSARKVVVAVDPTKEPMGPLRLGRQLARALRAPVVLVTVLPHHPLIQGPEDDRRRAARAEALERLWEIGRSLEDVHVHDALAITGTSPARSLQHVSEGADAAVIVVGSTTRGPLRRIVPGSVAERLVSGGACPVAVAPHGYADDEAEELTVVGVAFDGSEESQRALKAGVGLARNAAARLRVITVNERLAFGAVPVSADRPEDSVNRVIERGLRGAHDAAVAAHSGELTVAGVFRTGNPAQVLAEESREVGLLVAGSRGYGPVGAVLLGATTHGLLRSASCPLLITPRGRGLDVGNPA